MTAERITTFLIVTAIALLSLAVLSTRASDPYDGYLAYNEAWYVLIAQNYDNNSWFEPHPYKDKIDLNVPPFYSYLLDIARSAAPGRPWALRLVSIFMGVYCVILTFYITRELYGARAGYAAAALLAVCPVFVITARNIQTDGTFLCLTLAGFHFYIQYLKNKNPGTMLFSALLFSAALFTKQFAIIAIIALGISEFINNKYRIRYPFRLLAFIAIAAAIPGHFYLYHLIKNPTLLFVSNRYGALATAGIPSLATIGNLFVEMFFGMGPFVFILALAGLARLVVWRESAKPIILYPLLCYFLFFLIVHKHTYYMLAMAPFLCILAGWFLSEIRFKTAAAAIAIFAIGFGLVQSFMTLGALKFGYDRFNRVCDRVRSQPGNKTLVVEDAIMMNVEPVFPYYCQEVNVIWMRDLAKDKPAGALNLDYTENTYFFLINQFGEIKNDEHFDYYEKRILGPAFFGIQIYYRPFVNDKRMSTFSPGTVRVRRISQNKPFEILEAERQPSLEMFRLPKGWRIYKRGPMEMQNGKGEIYFAPEPND